LGWYEVTNLLKQVGKTKHIIGFDIVELCPAEGPAACVYTVAALAYRMIGYAVTGGNNG
jgi:agmatinase